MSSCEITSAIKAIETALPKHHVQSIKLQAYDENEEHVTHHAPVEHFEPERCGCECCDKTWITKEKVEPWRDDSDIVGQWGSDAAVSWCTDENAKKYYYEHLKDYQVNTLHFTRFCFCYNLSL